MATKVTTIEDIDGDIAGFVRANMVVFAHKVPGKNVVRIQYSGDVKGSLITFPTFKIADQFLTNLRDDVKKT